MSKSSELYRNVTISIKVNKKVDLRWYINEGAMRRNISSNMYVLMALKNQLDKDGIYLDLDEGYVYSSKKEQLRENINSIIPKIEWEED